MRLSKKNKDIIIHAGLFIITFITTTIAGAQWVTGVMGPFEVETLIKGLPYSIALLSVITAHEFGHYFAARFHKIEATYPYYIPFPPVGEFLNFGTMGAVIKTRSTVSTKKQMFDIGISGPLAGFVVCMGILIYGFNNYEGIEYILKIHPDYLSADKNETISLVFGNNLLFYIMKEIFIPVGSYFPPMSEIYHYPYLCVGWFGLFITALNMIPVGQLDGGHISYAMFGDKNSYKLSIVSVSIISVLGISGLINMFLETPIISGWTGWLLWSVVLLFIIKVRHPVIEDNEDIGSGRKILGYLSLIIFILSFMPVPFDIVSGM